MRSEIVALCAVAALLAGCGGSAERRAASAGILEAGGVIGVRYDTPTRNGVTDAGGTFQCVTGETVSFSIGAVSLGSAGCAEKVTLFTLAGLTPPTTEPALRSELDRARRISTPFTRAANLARFLIALDADSNPANGLDVRGREAALANAEIDFGLGLIEFSAVLERRVPNLTRNIPSWMPIAYLYRASNIVVPVHAVTRTDSLPSAISVVCGFVIQGL